MVGDRSCNGVREGGVGVQRGVLVGDYATGVERTGAEIGGFGGGEMGVVEEAIWNTGGLVWVLGRTSAGLVVVARVDIAAVRMV